MILLKLINYEIALIPFLRDMEHAAISPARNILPN